MGIYEQNSIFNPHLTLFITFNIQGLLIGVPRDPIYKLLEEIIMLNMSLFLLKT